MNNTSLPQFDRNRHGSLYDRGSADAYYGRPAQAHWWPKGTYQGEIVTELTEAECQEYLAGYSEEYDRKDWGVELGGRG